MTRHRTIILIVGCLVAFGAASSDAALASSLLSGYGGPGQGNQAILGSALLNRPGGGSGSSGGGSGETSSLASSAAVATTSPEAAASSAGGTTQSGSARTHKPSGSRASDTHRGSQAHRSATSAASPRSIAAVYAAAERNRPVPSTPALGLSGADLLLILLVLGMLALIGVLSRRLARMPPAASSRGAGGTG
jgi:hypothetical protein